MPYIKKLEKLYALGSPVSCWLNNPSKAWVYWKDPKEYFLGCNDLLAEKACLKNRYDITSFNDYDLFPELLAGQYVDMDKKVFNSGNIKQFLDFAITRSGDFISFLATKAPLLNEDSQICGVFGISIYLTERKLSSFRRKQDIFDYMNNIQSQTKNLEKIPQRIILNGIRLTHTESKCIHYFANGFSGKQIANKLSISYRTVESHFCHIKQKLGIKHNTELVEILYDNDFMNSFLKIRNFSLLDKKIILS